jgi:hypothetical protein
MWRYMSRVSLRCFLPPHRERDDMSFLDSCGLLPALAMMASWCGHGRSVVGMSTAQDGRRHSSALGGRTALCHVGVNRILVRVTSSFVNAGRIQSLSARHLLLGAFSVVAVWRLWWASTNIVVRGAACRVFYAARYFWLPLAFQFWIINRRSMRQTRYGQFNYINGRRRVGH